MENFKFGFFDSEKQPVEKVYFIDKDGNKQLISREIGGYHVLNKDFFDEQMRIFEEKEEEIKEALDYGFISVNCFRRLLDISDHEYCELVKPYNNGEFVPESETLHKMSEELRAFNCDIDFIKKQKSGSVEQVAGLQRLRFLIKDLLPEDWKEKCKPNEDYLRHLIDDVLTEHKLI